MNLQKIKVHRSATFLPIENKNRIAIVIRYLLKRQILYAGFIRQKLFEENEVLFKILEFFSRRAI